MENIRLEKYISNNKGERFLTFENQIFELGIPYFENDYWTYPVIGKERDICNTHVCEFNKNNITITKARRKGFWNIPYNPLDNES